MYAKGSSCTHCSNKSLSNSKKQQPHNKLKSSKISETNLHQKFNELFQQAKKRQLRKDQVRKELLSKREVKQFEQCTFKPAINQNKQFFISNDPFIKRQADWKSSVDKKIEAQRKLKQVRQKQSLTFQPQILGNPQRKSKLMPVKNEKILTLNYTMHNGKEKKSYKAIHTDHHKLKREVQDTCKLRQAQQTENQSQINQDLKAYKNLKTKAEENPQSSICSKESLQQPDSIHSAKPIGSQPDPKQEHQKQKQNTDHLEEVASEQNFDTDFVDNHSHDNFDEKDDPEAVI